MGTFRRKKVEAAKGLSMLAEVDVAEETMKVLEEKKVALASYKNALETKNSAVGGCQQEH